MSADYQSTAEATVAALIANGIEQVFCLPGIQNDHLFDALHGAGQHIRAIHTRHEQGAAYMALGAALATGRPSAYVVAPGPGVLNTTAALATAYACNAPVLCLTGQIPSAGIGRGLGLLHEIPDQLAILRGLTSWAERIRAPHEAAGLVTEAFRRMRSGRPRPVALECPMDVWGRRGPATPPPSPAAAERPPVDPDAIARAAAILARAERPLIIVGGGAQDAAPEVRALAERLQAPVSSHRSGRGVLDSRHPLAVPNAVGHGFWERADCVVAIGTRLAMQLGEWGLDDKLAVIRIDIDPEEMERIAPPAVGLLGDAAEVLAALLAALEGAPARPSREPEIAAVMASFQARLAALQPQLAYLAALRRALPEDGIYVDDLTQVSYAGRIAFPVYRARTFLISAYQGTLGWGYATALGAQAACPGRAVLSVNGDGGFLFTANELATAVQHRLPVVAVVFDDGAYGNVRRIQTEEFGNRLIASDLRNPDFVAFAASFGARAERATTPDELETAVRRGFASGEPTVIVVPLGEVPSPWDLMSGGRVRG